MLGVRGGLAPPFRFTSDARFLHQAGDSFTPYLVASSFKVSVDVWRAVGKTTLERAKPGPLGLVPRSET